MEVDQGRWEAAGAGGPVVAVADPDMCMGQQEHLRRVCRVVCDVADKVLGWTRCSTLHVVIISSILFCFERLQDSHCTVRGNWLGPLNERLYGSLSSLSCASSCQVGGSRDESPAHVSCTHRIAAKCSALHHTHSNMAAVAVAAPIPPAFLLPRRSRSPAGTGHSGTHDC